MEREAAVRKLSKILGKSLGYRVDPKAPKPDEREAARVEYHEALKGRKDLSEQMKARREALLAADTEYQELGAAYQAASKRADQLGATSRRYRITVGTTNSLFFHVRAEGDSWEEVIKKLTGGPT